MSLESSFSKNKDYDDIWKAERKRNAIIFAIEGTVLSGAYAAGFGFSAYDSWQTAYTKLDCLDAGLLTYFTGIMSLVSVVGSFNLWRDAINELKT